MTRDGVSRAASRISQAATTARQSMATQSVALWSRRPTYMGRRTMTGRQSCQPGMEMGHTKTTDTQWSQWQDMGGPLSGGTDRANSGMKKSPKGWRKESPNIFNS